jgi:hypothetical protein
MLTVLLCWKMVLARRQHLHALLSLSIGEDWRPLLLKIQLPVCTQGALYRMVGSRVTSPLRHQVAGTLFMGPNVLIGPLASGWMMDKIKHSSSEQERLRRVMVEVWRGSVQATDHYFFGRRDKEDRNPMFIYIEFPGIDTASLQANTIFDSVHPDESESGPGVGQPCTRNPGSVA